MESPVDFGDLDSDVASIVAPRSRRFSARSASDVESDGAASLPLYVSQQDCREYQDTIQELKQHQKCLRACVEGWVQQQDRLLARLQQVEFSSARPKRRTSVSSVATDQSRWSANLSLPSLMTKPLSQAVSHVDLSRKGIDMECLKTRHSVVITERLRISRTESQLQQGCCAPRLSCLQRMRWLCVKVAESRLFQFFCIFVVVINSGTLALSVENRIASAIAERSNPSKHAYLVAEQIFCVHYVLEIAIKIAAFGRHFFTGIDGHWNVFDMMLTGMAAVDQLSNILTGNAGGLQNMTYLRIVRIMKMTKLLRFIKLMRAFRELRMVLDSVMGSMKAMVWTVLLIIMIVFMFGICFTEAAIDLIQGHKCPETSTIGLHNVGEGTECSEMLRAVRLYWGSVGQAMLSLFMAATGGVSWRELAAPLWYAGLHYYAFFLIYIAFVLFVVMNALTSIFVDKALVHSQRDVDEIIAEQMNEKEEYMHKVAVFFDMLNSNGDRHVSFEEFLENQSNPHLVAFAQSLEIEDTDLLRFFQILSSHGTRAVDLEAFVIGCIKFRGPAKSLDVWEIIVSQKECAQQQLRFAQFMKRELSQLKSTVLGCASRDSPAPPVIPHPLSDDEASAGSQRCSTGRSDDVPVATVSASSLQVRAGISSSAVRRSLSSTGLAAGGSVSMTPRVTGISEWLV